MAEAPSGLGLRQLERFELGDRPPHAHPAVGELRRQFRRRRFGRDAAHYRRQDDDLRRGRETVTRRVAFAAEMLAQVHGQLRCEQLIARHDEGYVLGDEAMTIMVAEAISHQDDRASKRLPAHEIAMLGDRGRRVVLDVDAQHQDARATEDLALDQDIALDQERRQLGAGHGSVDDQWRLQHGLDIARRRRQ